MFIKLKHVSKLSRKVRSNNHGRRFVGGKGDIPPTFWSGCDVLCFVPLLFRGRHFCTNARGIHWMTGAIFVKFSQLILMKIIKTVATRCQILRLKCTEFYFGRPRPAGRPYSAPPQRLAEFNGPTSKWRGGEMREWKDGRGSLYFFLRIYTHAKNRK